MKRAPRRIYVTGPMRSGTTIIARLICEEILGSEAPPEATPLSDVLELVHRWRSGYEASRVDAWLGNDPDMIELASWMARRMTKRGDAAATVLLKDPEFVRFPIEFRDLISNGDPAVLVIRDPLDVMASALEVQKRQSFGHTREFYIQRVWESFEGLSILLAMEGTRPFNLISVRYENFMREPQVFLKRIAERLQRNLNEISPAKRTSMRDSSDPYVTDLMSLPPTTTQVGSYKDRLDPEDLEELNVIFSGLRDRLGYS